MVNISFNCSLQTSAPVVYTYAIGAFNTLSTYCLEGLSGLMLFAMAGAVRQFPRIPENIPMSSLSILEGLG